MSKDYKNRIPAYRQRQRYRTHQVALIAASAAAIAILAGVGVYFVTRSGGDLPSVVAAAGKSLAEVTPAAKAALPPVKSEPRFTFYKVLPDREVIISESEVKSRKREESLDKGAIANAYVVQAGSFTSQAEAERLRSRLADIRVKAKLELIKLDNTAWYRVRLGPYGSLADADKVRQRLRSNRIDSVVQQTQLAVR